MITILVWLVTIGVGVTLSGCLGSVNDAFSSLAAGLIVLITFQITRFFKVASGQNVSKMGTAWLSQQLRLMAWRMLLTLVLAALAFRLTYPAWGVAFWLSLAACYQAGLLLHVREIRSYSHKTELNV